MSDWLRKSDEQLDLLEMGWAVRSPDGRVHWFGDDYSAADAYWRRTDNSTEPKYIQKRKRREAEVSAHIPGAEGEGRFTNADEAVSWYNGWIQVSPTDPPEGEEDEEFKWDPVLKWYDKSGAGLYWYIVGTKDAQSLVIESEETLQDWVNQYYFHYAKKYGRDKADALIEKGRVVVARIPDLPASTPEAENLMSTKADEPPKGRPGPANEKDAWMVGPSRTAEEAPKILLIGTSGFSYKHWEGEFYPKDLPGKQRLAYYATKFPTIEVSSTFHNFPEFRVLQRWHDSTPHGFKFSIRGPHDVTHVRKLVDCGGIMDAFMRRLETLKDKLAVVTFQMQESAPFDPVALKGFLASLPKGFHYSMEFRSEPWYNDETYELLAKHDVALVTVGHSDKGIHAVQPATWGYMRLSGHHPDYKKNSYSEQDLKNWRGIVADSPEPTFVYFNNEYKAFAAHNATAMMDLMKVSWAPTMIQKKKKPVAPRRDLPKSLPGPKGPQNSTKDKYNSNPYDYTDDGSDALSTDPWAAKQLKYHFPFQPAAPHTK
jgi:uncharacterized protein YecE (DUF72 family)